MPYNIHLDKSNGLPSNYVYEVKQDSKGFIWICTDEGLSRFDGINFKNYVNEIQYSKAGNNILEDSQGRIWYTSFDLFTYFVDNDSLKLFKNKAGYFSHPSIIANTLFDIQKDKVVRYGIKRFDSINSFPCNTDMVSMSSTIDNSFFIESDSVLYQYSERGDLKNSINTKPLKVRISFIEKWNGKLIALGNAKSGTQVYEIVGNKLVPMPFQFKGTPVKFYVIQNTMYSLGNTSITRVDEQGKISVVELNFRPSCMMQDSKGNFWLGSLNKGLYLIPSFDKIAHPLPAKDFLFLKQLNNTFFIGTSSGELYCLDTNLSNATLIYQSKLSAEIYDVMQTNGKFIDVNNNFTGFNYKGHSYQVSTAGLKKTIGIDNKYFAFASSGMCGLGQYPDQKETKSVWDSCYRHGNVEEKNSFNISRLVNNVKGKSTAFVHDKIYFATNTGLSWFSKNTQGFVRYKQQEIYASQLESFHDVLYIINNRDQLLSLNEKHELQMNTELGKINSIKLSENKLIVFTPNAIFYQDLKQHGDIHNNQFFQKLKTDLVPEKIQQVLFVKNEILIVSSEGIFKDKIDSHKNEAVVFHVLEINRKRYSNKKVLSFTPNHKDISIQYAILDYTTPLNHELKYRINGEEWKDTKPESRLIELVALQSGAYEIEFQLDSKLLKEKVQFIIGKAWYQSTLFYLLLFISIGIVIYGIYKWQLSIQKEKNKLALEKIQLENSLKQSMMSSIKAQMNPHFLFNALNTIQSFIMSEDKLNASRYLSKFSKLTRLILEMSEQEAISLEDEINSLRLYLDLENMRFEDLVYNIDVSSELNIGGIRIPSMIIQPYVENAIKHGLLHKKGLRKLDISVIKSAPQQLMFIIDDNGIGRNRSNELNKIKGEKHKSFATEANLKRLDILNQENHDIGIEYIDKYDENNNPIGTTVKIKIPI